VSRTVVLDAEAVSRLIERTQAAQAWATFIRRQKARLHVSSLTLAELAIGTSRDAALRHAVSRMATHDVTPDIAFTAGAMRARVRRRKQRDLTVDAVVAATAASLPGPVVVLTSDPADLTALLEGTDVRVASLS
jgi:predicted nucleic acid-binding protein